MSKNLQSRLNELKPHVIGLRFLEGLSIIDTIFPDGWKVPASNIIKVGKNEENTNYHMFYSEDEKIGVDELLNFIGEIVKINIEREKKFELLKVKLKELEQLFKANPLNKLQNMKFILGDATIIPEKMTDDILSSPEITIDLLDTDEPPTIDVEIPETKQHIDDPYADRDPLFVGENDPDFEVERFNKINKYNDIELPPKKLKVEVEDYAPVPINSNCNCGPDEACPNCYSDKF